MNDWEAFGYKEPPVLSRPYANTVGLHANDLRRFPWIIEYFFVDRKLHPKPIAPFFCLSREKRIMMKVYDEMVAQ